MTLKDFAKQSGARNAVTRIIKAAPAYAVKAIKKAKPSSRSAKTVIMKKAEMTLKEFAKEAVKKKGK